MQKDTLTVATISQSANSWPLYVAQDLGFFTEKGLDVKIEITHSSSKQLQALINGYYDIGHQAADHIIRAVESGNSLFMFMGVSTPLQSLIVRPEIESYTDLRGKKLAVDGISSGYALLLRGLLAQNGLQEGKDYELVAVGGTGERFGALASSLAAGAFLDGPVDLVAEVQGYRRLGSNLDYLPSYQGTVAAARREWALVHQDVLVRYIKGYIMAQDWLHDETNKAEAIQVLRQHVDVPEDIAGQTYDRYVSWRVFNAKAGLNIEGLQQVIKVMVQTGELAASPPDPAKYYDLSYYYLATM
ncbi:SsuA/THI5-like [Moorella glycerini]|uniref:NMT1/THI5 like protein n=2 Tax=Neomoorella stamsii TaxID=1266720 RepID=A0A9X7P6I9_9FIRM|nr:NMT1/THI5 like protein [Moorella stamsii]CEP69350.1 SsuA/THI5-like [Moorella glycerini]